MPPPRKQKNTNNIKSPSTYVHPSLESRSSHTSTFTVMSNPAPNSVNEQIEHLRRAQARRATPSVLEALNRPSLIPRLPRSRHVGPPPPRSWLEGDVDGLHTFKHRSTSVNTLLRRPRRIDYFPGLKVPSNISLLHQSMLSMAMHFDWHLEYDNIYLAQLPSELKILLLSYIACHGPENGMNISGLKSIFFIDNLNEVAETTTNEDVDRLDLGGSLGRGLTLKNLGKFWRHTIKDTNAAQILDSWELGPSLTTNLRFPALTKLSLAYPGSSVTWTDLLAFSRNLGSLSHLSLAYWPAPRLSSSTIASSNPASLTTTTDSFDLSEAAYLLKMLSRNTPSLQYLSLEGCSAWIRALGNVPNSTPRRNLGRQAGFDLVPEGLPTGVTDATVEWATSWRNITHLNLSQGWIPLDIDPTFLYRLHNGRGKYSMALSTPRVPAITTLTQPSTLQPRNFPTARSIGATVSSTQTGAVPQESYIITAPSSVKESVQMAARRRIWCHQALEALLVDNWVRMLRKTAEGKPCIIDHGWDVNDLIEVGYAEQDLFAAGF